MSAATDTGSAFAGLADARQAVADARTRLAGLEQDARRAAAALEAAMAPARDYFERVGAGDVEPDPEHEAALEAELGRAHAFVRLRSGPGGQLEAVDERAEARLTGGRRALEAAEWELAAYVREHFDALAHELTARGAADRDALQAALTQTLAAREAYLRTRAEWRPLLDVLGLPADLPADPLRGLSDELATTAELPLPMPLSLTPTTTQED